MLVPLASTTGQSVDVSVNHIIHLKRSEDTLALEPGKVVKIHGLHTVWDDNAVTFEAASRWRTEADPLCDAAVAELFSDVSSDPAGIDLYSRLEAATHDHAKDGPSAISKFWHEITLPPPSNIRASTEDLRLARELFLDQPLQIAQSLAYFSLAGGFASPRIVKTLRAASYLIPKNDQTSASVERTFMRLLETFQFVLDVMNCSASVAEPTNTATYLLPGGEGWKSAVRVRMLHAVARARTQAKLSATDELIAINQDDMSATLASFSTIPLWTITLLGLRPEIGRASAYLALWRHVGFYMGVSMEILSKHFISLEKADKFLATTLVHAFSPDELETDGSYTTRHILLSVSHRPPLYNSYEDSCATARAFLGPDISDILFIPKPLWYPRLKLVLVFAAQSFPVRFARWYGMIRPGWVRKRRLAMSSGMTRVVRGQMGMRRTAFRPINAKMGQSDTLLDKKVLEEEIVTPDFAGGKELGRIWREIVLEMAAVTIGVVSLLGYLAFSALTYYSEAT